MGIIYQSTGDFNNAFIAYRNVLEIYEEDFRNLFSLVVPDQLYKDLLNNDWWSCCIEEFLKYQDKFAMQDYVPERPDADLIFFWHNGLSTVKSEWNINFIIDHRGDNMVVFTNEGMGISFPFRLDEDREKSDLQRLEVFRV